MLQNQCSCGFESWVKPILWEKAYRFAALRKIGQNHVLMLWIRFSTNYVMSLFCLFQILFFWWGDLQNAIHSDLIQFYSYKSDDIPAKVRGCIPYVWACVHQKAEVWSVETFLGRWIQNRKAPSLRFRVPQDVSRPSKVANWTSHQRKFEQPKSIMVNSITSSMICGSHYVTV